MAVRAWTPLILLACAPSPSPSTAVEDARHYAAAAATGEAAECAAIAGEGLRGECMALLARERAQADQVEEALALCAEQPTGIWRDECFFLVADVSRVAGAVAKRACAQAGKFRNQCVGHAIAREAAALFNDMSPGEEAAALEALEATLAGYIASPPDRSRRIRDLMADVLASRDADAPFSRATCGAAPDPICQAAYAERVRRSERAAGKADGAWRRACPTPSATHAAELDLPTWTADASGLVRAAWDDLCRQPPRNRPQ